MIWILYGLVFVVVGAVQIAREKTSGGVHVHRCAKCGTHFQHVNRDFDTAAALAKEHACPKCGAEQLGVKHFGPLTAAEIPRPAPAPPPIAEPPIAEPKAS